ncbi:MAG: TatD family hydrolase [archaeon]|nr:TatD family hydrolase [archaeon]
MHMLIDTHGHVNFNAFKEDVDEVIKKALDKGISIVMPGSQYSTSRRAVEIAERYESSVYAAIGIHPIHLEKREVDVAEVQSEEVVEQPWMLFETRGEQFEYEQYAQLTESEKVVAIGEIGLDYYRQPKNKGLRKEYREKQQETLREQIQLALDKDLPVILHCRVAFGDMIEILRETKGKLRGVMHSYTGDVEQAKELAGLGFYFGFNGLIFKEVASLPDPAEVISSIPLDRIVLETDSPYLVPPQAGIERNEPVFVEYIANRVAEIKGVGRKEVDMVTTENAKELFNLPD